VNFIFTQLLKLFIDQQLLAVKTQNRAPGKNSGWFAFIPPEGILSLTARIIILSFHNI